MNTSIELCKRPIKNLVYVCGWLNSTSIAGVSYTVLIKTIFIQNFHKKSDRHAIIVYINTKTIPAMETRYPSWQRNELIGIFNAANARRASGRMRKRAQQGFK